MSAYLFQTDEFGLDDCAIHFLRNRYRYHTVNLSTASVRVDRGADIRNWQLMLAFGLALVLFGLWYCWRLAVVTQSGEVSRIYIEEIVLPVLPVLLGVFASYMALRRGPVLVVQEQVGRPRTVSLREIEKSGRLERLLSLLSERAKQLTIEECVRNRWQA